MNFGQRFLENLYKAPGVIFGEGSPTGMAMDLGKAVITEPTRVGGDVLNGWRKSLDRGVDGIYKGAMMAESAINPSSNLNMPERFGRLLGGGVTAAREAAWVAPSLVLDPLNEIPETQLIGRTLSAVPSFLDEQAVKLYGDSSVDPRFAVVGDNRHKGAFQQSIDDLPMNPTLKRGLTATADVMREGGVPVVQTMGRVAFIKALGGIQRLAKAGFRDAMDIIDAQVKTERTISDSAPKIDEVVKGLQNKYTHDANSPAPEFKTMDEMRTYMNQRFGNEENFMDKQFVSDDQVKGYYKDYQNFLTLFKEPKSEESPKVEETGRKLSSGDTLEEFDKLPDVERTGMLSQNDELYETMRQNGVEPTDLINTKAIYEMHKRGHAISPAEESLLHQARLIYYDDPLVKTPNYNTPPQDMKVLYDEVKQYKSFEDLVKADTDSGGKISAEFDKLNDQYGETSKSVINPLSSADEVSSTVKPYRNLFQFYSKATGKGVKRKT